MFYVVQLDSVIFKEKIVVPSIWLDKYDTLCLLPPITDVADIETLAKAQSTPKHGWQMHSVSFLQSFDTYSEAKANITKGDPVMIDLEEEEEKQHHKGVREKRKRKLPRFLEQYSMGSDDDEKEGCGSTQDCSMEDNADLVPLIVKIETMEDYEVEESHQQPRLNTAHDESSSSAHSSLQHDNQLQVAVSNSSAMRLSLGTTPALSSESVVDDKCSNCSVLEKRIKTMEQEIVSLKRILMDNHQTTNNILTSINKREEQDILQRFKEFQRLKTSMELAAFIEKLKDKEVFSEMELDDPTPDTSVSMRPISLTPEPEVTNTSDTLDFDICDLLSQSNLGAFVTSTYQKNNALNKQARQKLVEIVVDEVLKRRTGKYKVHNHEWQSVSLNIVKAFPTELPQTYYVAPLTEGPLQKIAKGKLVDKFRNNVKLLKSVGLVTRKRKLNLVERLTASSLQSASQNFVITDELEQHRTWLRYNKEPWSEVLSHWNATIDLRTKAQNKSVQEIFTEWPVLKQPLGYTLLEIDFNSVYQDKELCLFTNFSNLYNSLLGQNRITEQQISYFQIITDNNVSQDYCLPMKCLSQTLGEFSATGQLTVLRKAIPENYGCRDAAMLMILPMLCPPKTMIILPQSRCKRHWKPSMIESQEGFILHLKSADDIQAAIERKREKMGAMGLTVQPFVIFVSESLKQIPTCYVSIDDVLYTVESPLKAVDVCFKAIHALNANYPPESIQVWMLLQKGVYLINTKFDKQINSVNIILSALKKD